MATNYSDARGSAEHYLRLARDSDLGSEQERLYLSMARVCCSMAVVDQMKHIADALNEIGDKSQDFRYFGGKPRP